MRIVDLGIKSKLISGFKDVTPFVKRITYNEGLYFCKDSMEVHNSVYHDSINVEISFCINEKKEDLNGPIYNSYFRNLDYIESMDNYQEYKNNLKDRIIKDYNRNKRNELNTSKIKHWRYRK